MRIWCLRPLWGRTRSRVKSPSARVNRRSTANSVFATEPSGRTQSLMEMMACSSLPSGASQQAVSGTKWPCAMARYSFSTWRWAKSF